MSNLLIINKVVEATKRLSPYSGDSSPTYGSVDEFVSTAARYDGKHFKLWYGGNWVKARTHKELVDKINACMSG